jgi:hypothetical protein
MKILDAWLPQSDRSQIAAGIGAGLLICAAALPFIGLPLAATDRWGLFSPEGGAPSSRIQQSSPAPVAELGAESASGDVRYMAAWIADSRDAAGSAFVIVDKRNASVYVFDAEARLLGSSPVLLGAAPGDDTMPGTGSRPLAAVTPQERTTPAGRFVGERGRNARGEDVVWVDYDAGVSMHRVLTTDPAERRLERLATPTIDDNRVSYGCINVPVAFYETYIRPAFATRRAIVYVLPEFKSLEQVFGSYDLAAGRSLVRNQAETPPENSAL